MASLTLPSATGSLSGSERSGCDVQIYNRNSLAVSLSDLVSGLSIDGEDGNPKLVSCMVTNAIQSGGTFQITIKCPGSFNPLRAFEANAWVDVSMRRGTRSWHVMRGLIDDIRRSETAPANTRTWTILGRSFQKVWSTTPVYFNNLTAENVGGGFLLEALGTEAVVGAPDANVRAVLIDLLRFIGKVGRANWQMPPGLPGAAGAFADTAKLDTSGFEGLTLARFAVVAQTSFPEVDLWTLANQFADLFFCEMYTELLPPGGLTQCALDPDLTAGLSPRQSVMTVVYRDRVYPRVSPNVLGPTGLASPYFSLPTHHLKRTDLTAVDYGWSDQENFNSFTVMGGLTQEQLGDFGETQYPLWWPASMQRHGLRAMPAQSMYEADQAGLTTDLELAQAQQSRLRDWYCLGAELLSGSISLARGAPQVKVGSRVVIEASAAEEQTTFYIEGVTHQWSAAQGLRTGLSVTRGYQGSDNDHLGRLATVASQFVLGAGP